MTTDPPKRPNDDTDPLKTPLGEPQVLDRVEGLDIGTARPVVCALVGHSKVGDFCFGYRTCGRCGETVGDSLASVDPGAETAVLFEHNCDTCRENVLGLTWVDTLLLPQKYLDYVETLIND